MKKISFLTLILLIISIASKAQSVSLSTTTLNPSKGTVFYNNGTNQLQYWNGLAWIPITNAAAGTGWAASGNDIFNANTSNVGIGTSTPKASFNIGAGKTVLFGADSSGSGSKLIWYPSKSAFRAGYTNLSDWDYANVGIGSTALGYRSIASGSNSTAIGEFTKALGDYSTAFGESTKANGIFSTAMGFSTIANGDYSTAMGISTISGANSSTALGKYNVDVSDALLMIGNGTDFYVRSNALTVLSNGRTGINTSNPLAALDVQGSSYFNGNVGIGTTSPIAPLHIKTSASVAETNTRYFSYGTGGTIPVLPNGSYNVGLLVDYDIVTKNSFVSAQTATTSDARIKNIIGLSNTEKDLELLKQIKITDYRYKDAVTWGTQTFKKVIAQEVEEIYPQAIKKMTATIPDIYTLSEKAVFDGVNKTLTVSLSKNYVIKVGEKIEFVHEKEGKIQAIVASVSGNSFTIKDWQYPTDNIFVYGREVDDFRSVDYEALSMLGISAIQQLAKEVDELKKQNSKLKTDLSTRLEAVELLLSKSKTGY